MNLLNKIGEAELNTLKKVYQGNLEDALKLIEEGYPIQYLIGYVDFYHSKILVNEHVLIPRFETEYLVEKAIQLLQKKKVSSGIDLCTGSGCIAIALKKNLNTKIDACDISEEALELAKEECGEDDSVYYTIDNQAENIYNISVRSKETTATLIEYEVNVNTQEVSVK